ncbi:MAG: 30S ribosomal protein S11 [Candidatus Pacearchaeota archaeon]
MAKEEKKAMIVYIYSTSNNTHAQVTDLAGNTVARVTGGIITKHDRLKGDPTVAMFIAKRIKELIKDYGVESLYIRIRGKTRETGPTQSGNMVIKTLSKEGFKILSIIDTTRFPRGGPKKKGGRRGRRV